MSKKGHKMIGEVFGSLKVLSENLDSTPRYKKFIVQCLSCSKIMVMAGGNLRRRYKTKNPGCPSCYKNKKHGLWNHECYKTWDGMIRRCYNKKHVAFNSYGGRGIKVCKQWRETPTSFIKWLIDNNWKKGLQIDRKNNDGDYTPKNCRAVTKIINANNKRNNHKIFINNENLTISEASRKYKINKTTIRQRLCRGWQNNELIRPVQQ